MLKLVVAIMAAALVGIVACSKDEAKAPPPEETKESVLNLRAIKSDTCPEIMGIYKFTSDKTKDNGETSFALSEKSSKKHFSMLPARDQQDLIEFLIEEFAFDEGGFYVDGQVYDKAEAMKSGVASAIALAKSPAGKAALAALGFDFIEEIEKFNLDNIKVGYVGGCVGGRLVLHYVLDNNGVKLKFTANEDKSLSIKVFAVENDGPLTINDEQAVLVNEEPASRKSLFTSIEELSKNFGQGLGNEFNKTFDGLTDSWKYPSSLDVTLHDSEFLTQSESITLRLKRNGFISNRHEYVLDFAFLGPEDNYFDDVTIEEGILSGLLVNMQTRKVYESNGLEVGVIIGEDLTKPLVMKLHPHIVVNYNSNNRSLKSY